MIALQSGDHVEAVRRQARRRKDTKTLEQTGVELGEIDRLYVNAYLICDSDRADYLMPIPYRSLVLFADENGFDEYQYEFLMAIVPIADGLVLMDRKKKQPSNGNAS